MKKIFACLLAVAMLLSFAACGEEATTEVKDTTPSTTAPSTTAPNVTEPDVTEPDVTEPTATEPAAEIVPLPESEITYFSLTCTDENGGYISLAAYTSLDSDDINIEMQTDVLKMGVADPSAMATIYERAQEVNFGGMNGMSSYTDGNAYGDFYIEFADGTVLSGMFGGTIPAEFNVAMGGMIVCFDELTANMEAPLSAPTEMGEIAENDKNAVYEIIEAMNVTDLGAFAISGIAMDENFTWAAGLSSSEGIISAVSFAPMHGSTPYSLVIVSLAEGTDAEAIITDFAESIDWLKLVCVVPEQAVIATKDNQVLMFSGSADLFTMTTTAIEACGWTIVNELTNPDM